MLCHFAHYVLFSKANALFCLTAYTTLFEWSLSIVSSVSYKTKQFANELHELLDTLSVLKPISFVVKWRCVVSMLSPLASKSYGGSHIFAQAVLLPKAGLV